MRYLVLAAGLAAVSVAAQAQNTAWGFFDGDGGASGAGVQAADGTQLMIRCDKPGKRQVYAVIVTSKQLTPPSARFARREVRLRFDDGVTVKSRWRYFGTTATAADETGDSSLQRFLIDVVKAKRVYIELDPLDSVPIPLTFDVTGAKEAVDIVYQKCKDTAPVAEPAAS